MSELSQLHLFECFPSSHLLSLDLAIVMAFRSL
jgi:hypothetical protein